MITAEQIVAAQRSNLETLFGLGSKAFEGVEKLIDLNVQVAKASIAEFNDTAKAALSVKDAQEFLSLQASLFQPAAEKAVAYSRHVYDITSSTGAEISKIAEVQVASAQQKFNTLIDGAVANAPAGTENAVALVKAAVTSANNAFESVSKAAKQATEAAEANFATMTQNAVKASTAAVSKAKRTA